MRLQLAWHRNPLSEPRWNAEFGAFRLRVSQVESDAPNSQAEFAWSLNEVIPGGVPWDVEEIRRRGIATSLLTGKHAAEDALRDHL